MEKRLTLEASATRSSVLETSEEQIQADQEPHCSDFSVKILTLTLTLTLSDSRNSRTIRYYVFFLLIY